jgi:hypothetical protein
MKKLLLCTSLTLLSFIGVNAQCVCYLQSAITFSTFPTGSNNVIPSFTNPFTTSPSTAQDDGDVSSIPIGFSFSSYCGTYTSVSISSNGYITFVPISWLGAYVHPTQSLPSVASPNGMIAFNMTDLNPGVGGTITYTTVGTTPNRMFIVTYSNVPCFTTTSDLNTGQIVLYETSNDIEIHTAEAHGDINQSGKGSQGIENFDGTQGMPVTGRDNNSSWFPATNTAYRFSAYSTPAPAAISGNTNICQGTVEFYSINSMTNALSYNWTLPNTWVGTSSTTAGSFTAGATGVLSVSAQYTCGASPSATLQVQVIPAPVVSITSLTPAIVCSGKTVEINVTGAPFYTLDPGGVTGNGPSFVDMPMVPTQYTLVGADANGCVSSEVHASVLVLESPTITVNSGTVCSGKDFVMTPSGLPPGSSPYVFSSIFGTVTQTVPGIYNYSVTGTSTNGCASDPAIATLTVYALPTLTLTSNRTTLCSKESITLTASGTGATTYTWSNSSATTQTISASPTLSGFINVSAFAPAGCNKSSNLFITVSPCSGIEENRGGLSFNVYPNPSTGIFQVNSDRKESIHVFDVLGRDVHHQQLSEGTNTLNLSQLAPGRYIIKGTESGTTRSIVITNE